MLVAAKPDLRGEELKDYLVGGAAEPRVDPLTGASVPAPSIGVPQGRLLDAYGSLTLLSRERPGTPLCGVEAQMEFVAAEGRYRLRIDRQTGAEYINQAPDAGWVGGFSVAQGGRLVAFDGYGPEPDFAPTAYRRRLTGGTWTHDGTVPGVERLLFLERDTAYLIGESVPLGGPCGASSAYHLRLRIGSADAARRVDRRITGSLPTGCSAYHDYGSASFKAASPVSPDGDWLYVGWEWDGLPLSCPVVTRGNGTYLFRTRDGAAAPYVLSQFSNSYTCDGSFTPPPPNEEGRVAWRADGREFYYGWTRRHSDGVGNHLGLQRYRVESGVTPVSGPFTIPNFTLAHVAWEPQGGRLFTVERNDQDNSCRERVRSAAGLNPISESVINADACFDGGRFGVPLRGNLAGRSPNPQGASLAVRRHAPPARPFAFERRRIN